jgi:hypothetical protein
LIGLLLPRNETAGTCAMLLMMMIQHHLWWEGGVVFRAAQLLLVMTAMSAAFSAYAQLLCACFCCGAPARSC